MSMRVKRAFTLCGLTTVLSLGLLPLSRASAAEYIYDQEKSRVGFTLRHLGLVTVEGHFKTFSGSFRFDRRNIEASRVNIAIRAATVDSGIPFRDRHLRSENFFAAEKYPEIRFESKKAGAMHNNRFNVEGDLTIHGITQPVIFETVLLTESWKMNGTQIIAFRAHTFIKRKDFRLGTGKWIDPILFVTDETLKISLEIEGVPSS